MGSRMRGLGSTSLRRDVGYDAGWRETFAVTGSAGSQDTKVVFHPPRVPGLGGPSICGLGHRLARGTVGREPDGGGSSLEITLRACPEARGRVQGSGKGKGGWTGVAGAPMLTSRARGASRTVSEALEAGVLWTGGRTVCPTRMIRR